MHFVVKLVGSLLRQFARRVLSGFSMLLDLACAGTVGFLIGIVLVYGTSISNWQIQYSITRRPEVIIDTAEVFKTEELVDGTPAHDPDLARRIEELVMKRADLEAADRQARPRTGLPAVD